MKVDLNKIIGYFNYNREQGVSIKVLRDWGILLGCSVVLFVLFLVADGYVFWKYEKEMDKGLDLSSTQNAGATVINQELLENILSEMERKKQEFESNLSRPKITDPSL